MGAPGRRSNSLNVLVKPFGPHQCTSGWVPGFVTPRTRARAGAANTRVLTISKRAGPLSAMLVEQGSHGGYAGFRDTRLMLTICPKYSPLVTRRPGLRFQRCRHVRPKPSRGSKSIGTQIKPARQHEARAWRFHIAIATHTLEATPADRTNKADAVPAKDLDKYSRNASAQGVSGVSGIRREGASGVSRFRIPPGTRRAESAPPPGARLRDPGT